MNKAITSVLWNKGLCHLCWFVGHKPWFHSQWTLCYFKIFILISQVALTLRILRKQDLVSETGAGLFSFLIHWLVEDVWLLLVTDFRKMWTLCRQCKSYLLTSGKNQLRAVLLYGSCFVRCSWGVWFVWCWTNPSSAGEFRLKLAARIIGVKLTL